LENEVYVETETVVFLNYREGANFQELQFPYLCL